MLSLDADIELELTHLRLTLGMLLPFSYRASIFHPICRTQRRAAQPHEEVALGEEPVGDVVEPERAIELRSLAALVRLRVGQAEPQLRWLVSEGRVQPREPHLDPSSPPTHCR